MINLTASKEDTLLIVEIAKKAESFGIRISRLNLVMDLTAAHMKCPLELTAMLNGSRFDFMHDVIGIVNNLNRETGEIENCFIPRYAKPSKEDVQ